VITTHVLNTAAGKPAAGVQVKLEFQAGADWKKVGDGTTDADGRVRDLPAAAAGLYRITFDIGALSSFYPVATVVFKVDNPSQNYHVPLLVSGFGYSTYRGS
jgi:5-hydroxyisourate hydrolase